MGRLDTAELTEFVAQTRVDNSTARGFQDLAEDTEGNAYVPTTFNVGVIAKISSSADMTPYYIGDASPAAYIYSRLVFGQVKNNVTEEVRKFEMVVATVDIGNSLYVNNEIFNDTGVSDVAGDRAGFPLVDSAAEFDVLVSAAGLDIITCSS